MSLTPASDPVAAPLLGEHTRTILREKLGYDEPRIEDLRHKGVFGQQSG
jgi:formyl-CoA transferase